MVIEYWDVFCEDGLHWPIQGFSFHIDTGSHSHIYCKPHRYSTHKSEVMLNLVESLDENGVVEEDGVPWVSLLVLAGKHTNKMYHGMNTSEDYVYPTKN